MAATNDSAPEYTAEDIRVPNVNHIRARPGMYVGGTGEAGLHQLLWELLDNSLKEFLFGGCRNIQIELPADGGCSIRDDGRGISVTLIDPPGQRFLELAFTRFGFRDFERQPCRMSGFHGLGLVCVNSLSRSLLVEVRRDGLLWRQEYERGQPVGPLQPLGRADRTGTSITFFPDTEIFDHGTTFRYVRIRERLREIACLRPGLSVTLQDHRSTPALNWSSSPNSGLLDLLEIQARGTMPIHSGIIHGQLATEEGKAEVAFRWVQSDQCRIVGFVNAGRVDAGTHITGLRRGVLQGWRKHPIEVSGEVIRSGLLGVVSVWLDEPMYEGSTKYRLNNLHIDSLVARLTRQCLDTFLRDHPDEADAIRAHIREPYPADAKTGV
jgi:DNA gyrase subunit B